MNLIVIIPILVALFIFVLIYSLTKRYKRCPSDRILVVYGKVGQASDQTTLSAKCIHGGAAFVWPIIQDYAFLDLTPLSIEVNLTNALSKQNIRVDVPSRFTIGISTEPGIMENAAERLLGLDTEMIHNLALDIIFGQLRLVVATMDIEEINNNRDKFLSNVSSNVELELKKIGLKLINVNLTDIRDESGYIEALGKEAAAKAINDAKKSVAEKNRDGSIGEAQAHQDQRIKVSDANAMAVEGENLAKIKVANSDALRRQREAEAEKLAIASEKVQSAKALEEAYAAETEAEESRADREKATQFADIVIPAQIGKEKIEIDAEAEAEQIRRVARGEADAIYAKKEAEAKGIYEILTKQAQGFDKLVSSAGNSPQDAALLLIADKLEDIVALQTEAIKNIKIDKVTVWDGGNNSDGKTSTSNFLSGMYKSVPPLQDIFSMAGMQLPEYLKGKTLKDPTDSTDEKSSKKTTTNED
ncbi:MAG: flotillin [Bacteroidetes bacterium]|nr:MAG: flotillin [Bacteroidota bacterium]